MANRCSAAAYLNHDSLGKAMLLIYTTSYDTTVDLLIHRLGPEGCFRFNFDLWRDYKLEVTCDSFRIEDPTGRYIQDASTTKVLWRKPFQTRELGGEVPLSDQDAYCEEELWYTLREIINLLWAEGKVVLVEPRADSRIGKFVQARVARRDFPVPDYQLRRGTQAGHFAGREVVVKSLSSAAMGHWADKYVLFTTKAEDSELCTTCPWMVQEYVEADKDITVAFVRDRLFAFELSRSRFLQQTIDWRELPVDTTACDWRPHELPTEIAQGVFHFMQDLSLHFGRLDFLCADGRYWFLEVNPNGQWGWLDAEGTHGLLDKVVEEISPRTPRHPIPMSAGWLRHTCDI